MGKFCRDQGSAAALPSVIDVIIRVWFSGDLSFPAVSTVFCGFHGTVAIVGR
jgi:hypothetical protein